MKRVTNTDSDDSTRLPAKKMSLLEKGFAGCITLFDELVMSRLMPNDKPKIGLELKQMIDTPKTLNL
jgi:hypothetical protein